MNSKNKAICCAKVFGISLCTILMSVSMSGSFAAAFSKDSSIQNIGSMSSMDMVDQKDNNVVLAFFSTFCF